MQPAASLVPVVGFSLACKPTGYLRPCAMHACSYFGSGFDMIKLMTNQRKYTASYWTYVGVTIHCVLVVYMC